MPPARPRPSTILPGDIHAFSDPNSNSGYVATAAELAAKGLKPEHFFRQIFFTYGHENVVRAVASGLAQSGSVDGYVYEVLKEVEPALTSATRVVRPSPVVRLSADRRSAGRRRHRKPGSPAASSPDGP